MGPRDKEVVHRSGGTDFGAASDFPDAAAAAATHPVLEDRRRRVVGVAWADSPRRRVGLPGKRTLRFSRWCRGGGRSLADCAVRMRCTCGSVRGGCFHRARRTRLGLFRAPLPGHGSLCAMHLPHVAIPRERDESSGPWAQGFPQGGCRTGIAWRRAPS